MKGTAKGRKQAEQKNKKRTARKRNILELSPRCRKGVYRVVYCTKPRGDLYISPARLA
jgi:hypothetical protein